MAAPLVEKGYTNAPSGTWWAAPDEETTPELRWPKSIEVYDLMRRQDAQVMSVLRAVTLPIRRTQWRIDGSGCRPEVAQLVADDLGLLVQGADETRALRTRDRFSWSEHLRLALLMLPFGHSFFEQTYRVVDGRARLRKLGWRPPRTISKVDVAADGGLVALRQHAPVTDQGVGRETIIPVSQLVAYVNDREGGNWFGQSLLRPAYKGWLLKDRALRTQAISLDRNGLGVPVYEGAEIAEDAPDREQREKDDLAAGLKLAQAYRGGENAGASTPHGSKLTLRGVEGTLPDADKPIRYHDEQIARAVLANFLNLGGDNSTGSYALGETFADFFTQSLQTVAMQIADVATQHIVEDLVDLNFGPTEQAPRLVFDEIGSRHPATAEAIQKLVTAGVITADEPLERDIRRTFGLPAADPTTARERPTTQTGGGSREA